MMIRAVIIFFAIVLTVKAFPSQFRALNDRSSLVGGKPAIRIQYQVSIERYNEHICGGAILSKWIIITAAHCLTVFHKMYYSIRAGTNNRGKGGQLIKASEFVFHPNFTEENYHKDFDIALIYLNEPLKFTSKIKKINLASANEALEPGVNATISGWGFLNEDDEKGSSISYEATVPVVDSQTCADYIDYLTDNHICAGKSGEIDACDEDSGGPLVVNGKLYGIISSGIGCARESHFGVYTSVPRMRSWINRAVKELKRNMKLKNKIN